MNDTLARVMGLIAAHGYPVLALVVLAEHTFLVGMVVPGDVAVLAAGALAGRGVLSPEGSLGAIVGGAAAGLLASYAVGARVGLPVVERWGARFGVGVERFEGLAAWFRRNGAAAVFLASFVMGLKNLVPAVAGATRMPVPRFVAAGVLGCTARALGFGVVGWIFGANLDRALALLARADRGVLVVAFALASVGLGAWLWRRRRHRRRARRA